MLIHCNYCDDYYYTHSRDPQNKRLKLWVVLAFPLKENELLNLVASTEIIGYSAQVTRLMIGISPLLYKGSFELPETRTRM